MKIDYFNLVFFAIIALGVIIGGLAGYNSEELACEAYQDQISETQCVDYFGNITPSTTHPNAGLMVGASLGGVLGAVIGAGVVMRFEL